MPSPYVCTIIGCGGGGGRMANTFALMEHRTRIDYAHEYIAADTNSTGLGELHNIRRKRLIPAPMTELAKITIPQDVRSELGRITAELSTQFLKDYPLPARPTYLLFTTLGGRTGTQLATEFCKLIKDQDENFITWVVAALPAGFVEEEENGDKRRLIVHEGDVHANWAGRNLLRLLASQREGNINVITFYSNAHSFSGWNSPLENWELANNEIYKTLSVILSLYHYISDFDPAKFAHSIGIEDPAKDKVIGFFSYEEGKMPSYSDERGIKESKIRQWWLTVVFSALSRSRISVPISWEELRNSRLFIAPIGPEVPQGIMGEVSSNARGLGIKEVDGYPHETKGRSRDYRCSVIISKDPSEALNIEYLQGFVAAFMRTEKERSGEGRLEEAKEFARTLGLNLEEIGERWR